jgi:hypothetical protein
LLHKSIVFKTQHNSLCRRNGCDATFYFSVWGNEVWSSWGPFAVKALPSALSCRGHLSRKDKLAISPGSLALSKCHSVERTPV